MTLQCGAADHGATGWQPEDFFKFNHFLIKNQKNMFQNFTMVWTIKIILA
jgi:hypothetical protein